MEEERERGLGRPSRSGAKCVGRRDLIYRGCVLCGGGCAVCVVVPYVCNL